MKTKDMKIDRVTLRQNIEHLIAEGVINGEEVDVTAEKVTKLVWSAIDYFQRTNEIPNHEPVEQVPEPVMKMVLYHHSQSEYKHYYVTKSEMLSLNNSIRKKEPLFFRDVNGKYYVELQWMHEVMIIKFEEQNGTKRAIADKIKEH